MQLQRLAAARLQLVQRLGLRHLVDEHLAFGQRRLGDAVPRLDQRGLARALGRRDTGGAREELADVDGVGGVVAALVDDLEHVVPAQHRGRDLDAAGAPAVGERHFA